MSKRNEMDDRFKDQMNAWLMIQVIGETSVNLFNSGKLKKEMGQHLQTLTFGEDPDEFAAYFIDTCLNSRQYKTTLFGALPMSEDGVALRIAQDINKVTMTIPRRFGYEEECRTISEAFVKAFRTKFDDSEDILKEAGII